MLKVSIYYTVFGTATRGVNRWFVRCTDHEKIVPGRSLLRGLLLFPYVAPVIAVAFSWVVLFDPFSGIVNAMLVQTNITDNPINFFWSESIVVDFWI